MITPTINRDQALDIMSTALEGGIGYWSIADRIKRTEGDDWFYTSYELFDVEDESYLFGIVTPQLIQRTWTLVAIAQRLGDMLPSFGKFTFRRDLMAQMEDDPAGVDADVADVLVQLGLFGEVVYG